jgi:ABC-type multidrug transport system ATPase subunit
MAQHKVNSLDQILFENVSFKAEGLDPVLSGVDLDLPMDQNVIIQSSNPSHAVHVLEILAGRKEPISGRIKWSDEGAFEEEAAQFNFHEVVGSYFESFRPAPDMKVSHVLSSTGASSEMCQEAIEHFEWDPFLNKKFRDLKYEDQKNILIVLPTLKLPQMLVLEDPATGISEMKFLNYLDWLQLWQRQGHLRHLFMTNHHPTAARHMEVCLMHVEEGLIYVDEFISNKKIVHF